MIQNLSTTQVLTLGSPAIAIVISGTFFCLWKFHDHRSYLILLASAFLLYATGAAMQILRWPADPGLNNIVSTAAMLASITSLAAGLAVRYGRRAKRWLILAMAGIWLVNSYFCYASPEPALRSYALNFGIGLVLCAVAWRIRHALRGSLIDRGIFWILLLFGLSFFGRPLLTQALPGYLLVPNWLGSQAFDLILQVSLVLMGLVLALLLFAASVADMFTRMRNDRDIDGLTGLWNRRAFDERLESLIARAPRQPYTLLLIDIDHFKSFNDRYGHAVGDTVLRLMGRLIRDCAGDQALTGRVGGEEFAVVVPTEPAEAHELALCLSRALRDSKIPDIHEDHQITASTGLTMLQTGDTVSIWMRRADILLYQAKHGGRNRIVRQASTT